MQVAIIGSVRIGATLAGRAQQPGSSVYGVPLTSAQAS
jgi:hypothetical protein